MTLNYGDLHFVLRLHHQHKFTPQAVQLWLKVVATPTAESFTLGDERNDHPIQIVEE